MRAVHFCEACGKVQPPAPVDYFTFFGLPRKLDLDVAALDKDFYELSRKLHPDLNAQAGSQEQEWSLQQSSLLNDAYRTLKDPIKRTEYLLKLEGVELEEQSKTATEQGAFDRRNKEADRAAGAAGRGFRAEYAARRTAHAEEDGRRRSRPDRRNRQPETRLEEKQEALLHELKDRWKVWDGMIQREQNGQPVSTKNAGRSATKWWTC